MSKEIIDKIKEVEAKATKDLAGAKDEAEKLVADAREEAKKLYDAGVKKAKEEAAAKISESSSHTSGSRCRSKAGIFAA